VHDYDAQQHRAGQIISPLTFQTITIAQMLSVGREEDMVRTTLSWKTVSPSAYSIHANYYKQGHASSKT